MDVASSIEASSIEPRRSPIACRAYLLDLARGGSLVLIWAGARRIAASLARAGWVLAFAFLLRLPVVVRSCALACSIILLDHLYTIREIFVALNDVAAIESTAIRS